MQNCVDNGRDTKWTSGFFGIMKVVQKFSEISDPTAILYNAKNKQRNSLKTHIFSRWQVNCKSI